MPSGQAIRELMLPSGTRFDRGEAVTIGLAYFTVGLTVSVLHVAQGTSAWVMIATVFLVNSVTPGLAFAAVTATGGSTVAGVAGGLLASSRFGLFAAAIAPRLWPSRVARAIGAHAAFDPNVALAMREENDDGARRVYTAASLWLCLPWWVGGVLGTVVGSRLGDPDRFGLDAVFPAVLLAILWPQLNARKPFTIALLAAVVALVLLGPTPGGVPVLAAAACALLVIGDDSTC